ncbi:terminase small subunit [Terrisporobacter petrolearius]|uniref:terminase small subunit n=1 Tax=Terrisporobacter petrolearius TaxID=1460447 RepID=UPI0031CC776A
MEDVKTNAKEEYLKGTKQKDICNKYNISINTLKSWIKRYKWSEEKRNKGAPIKKRGAPFNIDKKNAEKQAVNDEVELVLENNKLTEKQKLFCIYYIRCFNATKAYQKAYKCSYNTANVEGYKTLVKPSIKAEISELKKNKFNRAMLSEDDIFQKYIDIAFSDITDYLGFGNKEVKGENGPYFVSYITLEDSDNIDGTLINEISQGKDGIKLKLQDKMKALQWLSDRMDLLPTHTQAKLDLEIMKLEVEMNKLDNTQEEVEEDGFIEALDDTTKEVWDDEED